MRRLVRWMLNPLGYHIVRQNRPVSEVASSPPKIPDECIAGPPNFVGIGAQKSGTSWWFDLIMQHPSAYFPKHMVSVVSPPYLVKERHFFDKFFIEEFTNDHIDEYYQWFPRVEGTIAGEWTPRYMFDPWVPPLLKFAAPDAKLLVMLRDPVERFISGMSHSQRSGQLNPNQAVEHFMRGRYNEQMSAWVQYYERTQILVLQYEHCVANPVSELKRTYRFLEVDESWKVDFRDISKKINVTQPGTRYNLTAKNLKLLVERYSDDVKQLTSTYNIDLSLWPNFRHL
jgi:hypothetical protein